MENNLQKIKNILESEAGFIVNDSDNKKTIIDNRFKLLKQAVNSLEDKDTDFYSNLVKLISDYIGKLYDVRIDDFPRKVLDLDFNLILQDYDRLDSYDLYNLTDSNRDFASDLFKYVCKILKQNKDIKLDKDTLTKLLNRNPKLFSLSVEESYLYRPFDFKKLVKTIKSNKLLEKSNISIDDIYEILINSCQLNNREIFPKLISSEDFKLNHNKISELLKKCNAKSFVEITGIIVDYIDKNFDRMSYVKERKNKDFTERLLINMLANFSTYKDYNFIHRLLTDESLEFDYDCYYADYFGQTSLKELIAFSGNRIITRDLLSKEDNIQSVYWYGESKIQLYRLYAITGEYEKALALFQQNYNYAYDFSEDYTDGFNKDGQAHGDITYKDSLVEFIDCICKSFELDNLEYLQKRDLISRIFNSENIKYINLDEVLPTLKEQLSDEDYYLLIDSFKEKYNSGNLGFIEVNEQDGIFDRYLIKIADDEKSQEILSELKNNDSKILSLKRQKRV